MSIIFHFMTLLIPQESTNVILSIVQVREGSLGALNVETGPESESQDSCCLIHCHQCLWLVFAISTAPTGQMYLLSS